MFWILMGIRLQMCFSEFNLNIFYYYGCFVQNWLSFFKLITLKIHTFHCCELISCSQQFKFNMGQTKFDGFIGPTLKEIIVLSFIDILFL